MFCGVPAVVRLVEWVMLKVLYKDLMVLGARRESNPWPLEPHCLGEAHTVAVGVLQKVEHVDKCWQGE